MRIRTIVCMVVLLLVAVAVPLTLWRGRSLRWASERSELLIQIAAAREELPEQDPTGGAETVAPEPESRGRWTFPIHERDYLTLTSPYGYRKSPVLSVELWHQGVDIAAVWRAQVVAMADGVVVEHWPAPGTLHPSGATFRGHAVYGAMIQIEHEGGWRTLYAHMHSTRVHTGQLVRAGEVIGRIGNTGMSRGSHLHLEIMDETGERLNPLLYTQPEEER